MKGKGGIFLVKDSWPKDKPVPAVRAEDIRFEPMTFGSFDEFVAVSDRVEAFLKELNFGEPDGFSIIAFSEALNNAFKVMEKKQSWKRVQVDVMFHPDHWFFVFITTRSDPESAYKMHFDELPDWEAEAGRGAYIMRTLAHVLALNFPADACALEFIIGLYRDDGMPHDT